MRPRTCGDVRADLSAYLDDELDPVPAGETRAHLEHCSDCRSELDLLRLTVGALRRLPDLPPPAAIFTGVRARLLPDPWYRRRPAGRRWSLGVPIGALATVLVIIGISLFQTRFPDVSETVTTGPSPQSPEPPAPELPAGPTPSATRAPAVHQGGAGRTPSRPAEELAPFAGPPAEPKVDRSSLEQTADAPRAAFRKAARREVRLADDAKESLPTFVDKPDHDAVPGWVKLSAERSNAAAPAGVVCLLSPDGDTVDDLARLLRGGGAGDITISVLEPRAVLEAFAPYRERAGHLPEPSLGWTVTARIPPRSRARLLDSLVNRTGLRILALPAAPAAATDAAAPLELRVTVLR